MYSHKASSTPWFLKELLPEMETDILTILYLINQLPVTKGRKIVDFFFLIEPHIIVYLCHLSELKQELIKVLIKLISEGGL